MGSCRCGYNLFTKRGGGGRASAVVGSNAGPAEVGGAAVPREQQWAGPVGGAAVPRDQQWAGHQLMDSLRLRSGDQEADPLLGELSTGKQAIVGYSKVPLNCGGHPLFKIKRRLHL